MNTEDSGSSHRGGRRWIFLLIAGAILVLIIAIVETGNRRDALRRGLQERPPITRRGPKVTHTDSFPIPRHPGLSAPQTAEQIVSNKLSQFAVQRREISYAFASKKGVTVPPEVLAFYEAVEAGDWYQTTNLFQKLWDKKNTDQPGAKEIRELSGPLLETFGVAEQAHDWPAEKLLEYGHSILDSLKPGMVYVGGTDPGRFVPTLLNETTEDGERHVILTQNGLADGSYTDYLRFLYGEQLEALDSDDSGAAFQSYLDDAKKRAEHDRDFPHEPKQLRKGEDVKIANDGRINIAGQTAVMDINERLLNAFMKKNPDLTFAMEESFSLKSTYTAALPLGPIFQINSPQGADAITAETVNESVNYWQKRAQEVRSDSAFGNYEDGYKTYAHLANAQGNLFAERGFTSQAEQTYRTALQIWPGSYEAANKLHDLLMANNRTSDAKRVLDDFERNNGRPPTPPDVDFAISGKPSSSQ